MGTITRSIANNVLSNGTIDATDGLTGTIPASNLNNASISNLTAFPATVGDFVEATASDVPASPSTAGQLFYNSTSGTLKGISLTSAAWASGGTMPQVNTYLGGSGTQTAALAFAGNNGTGSPTPSGGYGINGVTQEYNGSSWTTGGLNPVGKQGPNLFGTQTASIGAAGYVIGSNTTSSYLYNGSSWSSTNSMNNSRQGAADFGIQTAGIICGGSGASSNSESYDGSTWSNTPSLNTSRSGGVGGSGTQTAGLISGGETPAGETATEEYDGSTWTSVSPVNNARRLFASGGIQTSAFVAGGYSNPLSSQINSTELYDGTSWTNNVNMVTTRYQLAGAGTVSSGLAFGGYTSTASGATEEYTGAFYSAKTLTTS